MKTLPLDVDTIRPYVSQVLDRRECFLHASRNAGSPLYILDEAALSARAGEFMAAFQNRLPDVKFYYAVKSNNHPDISKILLGHGYGLDVSSGEELAHAIRMQARDIAFSGPGKTVEELSLAAAHSDRVTVLMDSFGELERLEQAAGKAGVRVRTGVRLCTDENGLWRRFGIPLKQLALFMEKARLARHVALCGFQFHISWNLTPDAQADFLRQVGQALEKLSREQRRQISFVDIGGGYWPPSGEWLQSDTDLDAVASVDIPSFSENGSGHFYRPAASIDRFARHLAAAIHEYIFPHRQCMICLEPGRWLCHDAMHILLTVIDKKADDLVITDGGTNAVGWERFESDYFPVINLTRPGLDEKKCLITGSLCTPHDIWGYGYWGEAIEPGDVLIIPSQGAYTYSLRQHFIKPLPKVVTVNDCGGSHG